MRPRRVPTQVHTAGADSVVGSALKARRSAPCTKPSAREMNRAQDPASRRLEWSRLPLGRGCERDVSADEVVEAYLEVPGQQHGFSEFPGCTAVEPRCHLGCADPAEFGEGGGGDASRVGEPTHGCGDGCVDRACLRVLVHESAGWPRRGRVCKQNADRAVAFDDKSLTAGTNRCMLLLMVSPLSLLMHRIVRDSHGASLRDWALVRHRRQHRVAWADLPDRLARVGGGRVAVTALTPRSWFVAELTQARVEDDRDAGRAGGRDATGDDGGRGDDGVGCARG